MNDVKMKEKLLTAITNLVIEFESRTGVYIESIQFHRNGIHDFGHLTPDKPITKVTMTAS